MKMPVDVKELMTWNWEDFAPAYQELEETPINAANVESWLDGWSAAARLVDEFYNRAYVATSINTQDKAAEKTFEGFMEKIYPQAMQAEQRLKQKLLASGLQVRGFELQLRNMRSEADLFRESNLPLEVEEQKLNTEHDKIMGAQTVEMDGVVKTQRQLEGMFWNPDRAVRERAWNLMSQRQLADREAINTQWQQYMKLRLQIAKNADKPDYRAYRWQLNQRFDYTPQDAKTLHNSIEKVVVPFTMRLAEKRRQRLGLKSLRYYDLYVDYRGSEALKPFKTTEELENGVANAFAHVDPDFGKNFNQLRAAGLLDTGNRPNKAAGAYCTSFAWTRSPFIFGNAVGINDDVRTLLHEGGHAMHDMETMKLRWNQQRNVPMEFNEVASMSMEMLASPYLVKEKGGFYTREESARSLLEQLELNVRFWPYMAIVDAFQHWVYENPQQGADPAACDSKWMELEKRFRPYIDWSGAEEVMATGWHRKDHIHVAPFYYIEYGLAQLGASQVWGNSLKDERTAVQAYRAALKLGGTATLPEIYKAAGARLAFDAGTLGEAVALIESKMSELEAA